MLINKAIKGIPLDIIKSSLSSNANLSSQDCVKYFLPTISLINILMSHLVIQKQCSRNSAVWRRCAVLSPYWLQYWRHGSEIKAPTRLSHIAVGDSRNLYLITCLWSDKCSLALTEKILLLERCTWWSLWYQSSAVICKTRGKLHRKKNYTQKVPCNKCLIFINLNHLCIITFLASNTQ